MTPNQLRKSILQLAIEGKLVSQIKSEGTAEDLYKQIQREKAELIKKGVIKKEKPLEPISEDEIPFDIPQSWKWVHVASISTLNPKNDLPDALNVGFIPMPCVNDGFRNIHTFEIRTWGEIKKGFTHFANGDIGIAKITPCFQNRKSVIFQNLPNGYGAGTTELSIIRVNNNLICGRYLLWFFKSEYFISNGVKSFTGTAGQQRIHKDYLGTCLLPLPPLAEQKRIVEKIEELLSMVDRYGEAYNQLTELENQFPIDLKKSVLQHAMEGKLVPQIESEGNAEDLYKQIQKEKADLIKKGAIKKEKPLNPITEDEIPFDIPETWKWVRLKEIVYNNGQKTPTEDFSYIDIGSIDNTNQRLNTSETIIHPSDAPSRARKIVKYGDIVYSTVRPYLHNMAIIDKQFMCEPIASTGFAVMRCFGGVFNKYLFRYLLSPWFDSYANDNENSKGVAYPAINDERLYKAVIPLPPLAEQKRIVEKIEELFSIIDHN